MHGSHRSSEGRVRGVGRVGRVTLPTIPALPTRPTSPYTAEVSMSEDSTRNWTRTYVSVIVIEVLALMGLWWLQSHYGT